MGKKRAIEYPPVRFLLPLLLLFCSDEQTMRYFHTLTATTTTSNMLMELFYPIQALNQAKRISEKEWDEEKYHLQWRQSNDNIDVIMMFMYAAAYYAVLYWSNPSPTIDKATLNCIPRCFKLHREIHINANSFSLSPNQLAKTHCMLLFSIATRIRTMYRKLVCKRNKLSRQ